MLHSSERPPLITMCKIAALTLVTLCPQLHFNFLHVFFHPRSSYMSWFILSSFVECKLFEIRTLSFSYCIPTSITISSTKEVLDKCWLKEKRVIVRVKYA